MFSKSKCDQGRSDDVQMYGDRAATEASKPIAERERMFTGRDGETQAPRRHHLPPEQQQKLLEAIEASGKFVSPYKRYGAYWGITEALARLGENESHLAGDVLRSFEEVMSEEESKDNGQRTAWDRFRDKPAKSKRSGLALEGRFLQDVRVLQRIGGRHPYALKLAQLGACIDILSGPLDAPMIRLRTGIPAGGEVSPINEKRKRESPRTLDFLISRKIYKDAESDVAGSTNDENAISDKEESPLGKV